MQDEQRWPAEHHRLRSVIIFYVPGGCTLEMGPTAIIPEGHLLSRDVGDWGPLAEEIKTAGTATTLAPALREIKLTAPKGQPTAVLLHHSMFHRGTARMVDEDGEPLEERVRPMFKFIFTRCREPTAPDWDADGTPVDFAELLSEPAMVPALESLFDWQKGEGNAPLPAECSCSAAELAAAEATLLAPPADGDEAVRTGAAYVLARAARAGDAASAEALVSAVTQRESSAGRRCAAHALTAAGVGVIPRLLGAMNAGAAAGDWEVVVDAADAIGEAANPSAALVDTIAATAQRLHSELVAKGLEAFGGAEALPPLHNRWVGGRGAPVAAVGSLVLALDHLAMRAAAQRTPGWEELCAQVCTAVLPFVEHDTPDSSDDLYQHQSPAGRYSHVRAPVLAAECLGNLALHPLPASLVSEAVTKLQRSVRDRSTSPRMYAPAMEGLRRLTASAPAVGAGTRAARRVVLNTWGLVDQQNNRGFAEAAF